MGMYGQIDDEGYDFFFFCWAKIDVSGYILKDIRMLARNVKLSSSSPYNQPFSITTLSDVCFSRHVDDIDAKLLGTEVTFSS